MTDPVVTAVKADVATAESSVKTFALKYWPILAGVLIALTRLI